MFGAVLVVLVAVLFTAYRVEGLERKRPVAIQGSVKTMPDWSLSYESARGTETINIFCGDSEHPRETEAACEDRFDATVARRQKKYPKID